MNEMCRLVDIRTQMILDVNPRLSVPFLVGQFSFPSHSGDVSFLVVA